MAGELDPGIDAYIDALPDWQQAICREVRALLHEADPEVAETVKRRVRPYFVLDGNVAALLAAKDHVTVLLYDGGLSPDPEGIITGGHGNATGRFITIHRGEPVNRHALLAIFRSIIAVNRAGGWRKAKRRAPAPTVERRGVAEGPTPAEGGIAPDEQIARVLVLVRAVLRDVLLGAYLHGSAASDGLRPTSDLDIVVVASRRTTPAERRALIAGLLPISGRGDPSGRSRSLEVTVVAQPDVVPWRYPARTDVQYGDWFRPEFERGDLEPWDPVNPDLAIVLTAVLRADHPLAGPPPSAVLAPIPWADIRRALLDSIPDLRRYLDGDERNVVLTFVRIWATLATGEFTTKDRAAGWALPRLPSEQRPVLERARELYLAGIRDEDWGELRPRIPPFVEHVVAEIDAAARGA